MKYYTDVSNYDHTKQAGEKNIGISATIPDQSFTLRQIMDKFASGQPINDTGNYNDFDTEVDQNDRTKPDFDSFIPHPKTLDLVDQQELRENIEKQRDEHLEFDKETKKWNPHSKYTKKPETPKKDDTNETK